jgi:hypothetical protein
MTHPFPVIIVVNIFVETFLRNCAPILSVFFFLKEHFVGALGSSSTSSLLFEINSGNLQCGRRGGYVLVIAQ